MEDEDTRMHRSRDSDALQAAFAQEGCPVCYVVLAYMQQAMDSWQYEGFTNVAHRHDVIRARGFCPLHTWQLAQRNNAFQLGIIYREILADVLPALQKERDNVRRGDATEKGMPALLSRLKGQQSAEAAYAQPAFELCYFCGLRAHMEHRLIETLIEQLRVEEMRVLLSQTTGLCLVHFTQAHEQAATGNKEELPALLDCQYTCMQRVYDEVQELVRKHDYRASNEAPGNEMTSWRRAAELCAGDPGVR